MKLIYEVIILTEINNKWKKINSFYTPTYIDRNGNSYDLQINISPYNNFISFNLFNSIIKRYKWAYILDIRKSNWNSGRIISHQIEKSSLFIRNDEIVYSDGKNLIFWSFENLCDKSSDKVDTLKLEDKIINIQYVNNKDELIIAHKNKIIIINATTKKTIKTLRINNINQIYLKEKKLIIQKHNNKVVTYDTDIYRKLYSKRLKKRIQKVDSYYLYTSYSVYDLISSKQVFKFRSKGLNYSDFISKESILFANKKNIIYKINISENKLDTFFYSIDPITKISFEESGNFLVISTKLLVIYKKLKFPHEEIILCNINNQNFVFSGNNYFSDKSISQELAFKLNNKVYYFDQFDLKYNRPDLILKNFGYSNDSLIKDYYLAYQKRLSKLNYNENILSSNFHIPEIYIQNLDSLTFETESNTVRLNILAADTIANLNRLNIWVNGVPVFGKNGKNLSNLNTQEYENEFEIELMPGNNKIQVSCLNENAAESYKETVEIIYEPTQEIKPNIYILGIGASKFQNIPTLPNTDNDIREFVDFYKAKEGNLYQKVFVDTFMNENVLRDDILAKKDWLQNTSVNDIVIVYYSGHGSIDDNNDYYLYSYDIDTTNISKYCIQYDELESLIDGIPARRKLFLVNACFSGEYDEDIEVFRLMKETFPELRRGTGVMTIASSFADEFGTTGSRRYGNNSAFGYAIQQLFEENQILTVNELKNKLEEKVFELSRERQKPTFRNENLEMDFRIW